MKNIIPIVFIIVLAITTQAQNQQKDTLIINEEYANSKKTPIVVNKGTVVISNIDNLHLVNQLRYNFYEELRTIVRDSIDKDIENIVLKYEKILKENDALFNILEDKCNQQSSLYKKSTEGIKLSLTELENTLNLTQQSLESANKSLDLANQQLKESKKKQFWKKFGLIGSGVGIGLLTGILLTN